MLNNKIYIKKEKLFVLLILFITLIIISPIKSFANTVEYKGEAEGIITTNDDFFDNLNNLMPGDTAQEKVYIKNVTKDEVEVFFKTEPLEKNEYDNEIDYLLLEKIKLKIILKSNSNSEEKLLYEGNLKSDNMTGYISLGTYKRGAKGEFIFKIEVPKELNNKFALSSTKYKWIFAVEKKEQKTEPTPEPTPEKNPTKEEIKTGDKIYYAVAILILAIIVSIIIIVIKRKDSKED